MLMALNCLGEMQVWDITTRRERTILQGRAMVTCGAFSSDGRSLAVVDSDSLLKVWDLAQLLRPGLDETDHGSRAGR
jgi:WD40 repeat protein